MSRVSAVGLSLILIVLVSVIVYLIPWPIGKRGRARSLILTGGLIRAVQRESAIAVSYWWGVSQSCVTKWRNAFQVPLSNDGTHRLRHEYAGEPGISNGLVEAQKKFRDPDWRAKIGAAHRGKRISRQARKLLSEARKGVPLSIEHRRKIGASLRERGILPIWVTHPWTPEEDAIVRTLPPQDVATRTGRTLTAIYHRRRVLGVAREYGYNGTELETRPKFRSHGKRR